MKRKKRHIKPKYPFLDGLLNSLKERLISVVAIAVVLWIIGILTNSYHTSDVINQLQKDNLDLNWAVDYFRR